MTTQADHDLERAGQADALAAMLARTPGSLPPTQGNNLTAREIVLRFRDMVFNLTVARVTYSPTMDEPSLRAWAAEVNKTIGGA